MPDESCRKCGGNLRKYTLCAECKKIASNICIVCGTRSLELAHHHCFLIESLQTRTNVIEDAYSVPA